MRILSVSDFLGLVNETLKALSEYEEFGVEGEISGYRVSQGQWVSFDLKDETSLVNIFLPIWKQTIPIEDGMKVRITGVARIYPKYGKFSLSAEKIEPIGEGALRKALAALRLKLENEGLFDPGRKRALPRFPKKIALIASRESAAYGDFVRIVGERWPLLEIDLYHVLVQGDRAPADVMRAFQTAQQSDYDAIILTRGGGSFEELMAFNDERLTRAIYASQIPTLVAIGHERDVSLVEEVADVRGSTPTDAARRLVPDHRDIEYELSSILQTISGRMERQITEKQNLINGVLQSGSRWLEGYRFRLDQHRSSITDGMERIQERMTDRITGIVRLLKSLDPKAVLERGYSIVRDTKGRVVASTSQVTKGDVVELQLKDGVAGASVQVVRKMGTPID
ncbi:exodeoxyribonuclease VII large subunit [Candidatus Uhrbacteria bacterium]|nr:exodeoxyribonuclease VII large subunit [Candidatus Uhrbacteria bacterium]MBD3284079.1 exodeoxyribonuclease VII large subunit [Candidatus Uhrbacteria bacterium]